MTANNSPQYPIEYFEEIDGSELGEYLAFLFEDETPVGTLTGVHLEAMIDHLKEHANKTNRRYVLVQVIDTYEGQTIH